MSHSDTYVLIHGAWHGGWCWSRVADRLRQAGHRVHVPTLPGLGDRAHLLSPSIDLEAFIQDICQMLEQEDLRDVILVGHSFGGLVISGVVDRLPERIARMVFLDAFLTPPGKSTFDTLPAEVVTKLEDGAATTGGIAPPRAASLGLTDPADIDFVQARLTPQPVGTYREPLQLQNSLGNGRPVTYVRCTQPLFPAVAASYAWTREAFGTRWTWADLETGHDAMISAPEAVTAMLMQQ